MKVKIEYSAPLHPLDTELQTYGCRANNPDICAFTSDDCICKKPSRTWENILVN